mmetsp:Transcript_10356/g.29244  ORF Transcript_10356/g.29244 Transcript_10356/m.29244 type:complete len:256 (+) Transcript_10356:355-1122(+)
MAAAAWPASPSRSVRRRFWSRSSAWAGGCEGLGAGLELPAPLRLRSPPCMSFSLVLFGSLSAAFSRSRSFSGRCCRSAGSFSRSRSVVRRLPSLSATRDASFPSRDSLGTLSLERTSFDSRASFGALASARSRAFSLASRDSLWSFGSLDSFPDLSPPCRAAASALASCRSPPCAASSSRRDRRSGGAPSCSRGGVNRLPSAELLRGERPSLCLAAAEPPSACGASGFFALRDSSGPRRPCSRPDAESWTPLSTQ